MSEPVIRTYDFYWAEISRLERQLAQRERQTGEVLAIIHGDGGHYVSEHGWEKACRDAIERVNETCGQLDQVKYQLAEIRKAMGTKTVITFLADPRMVETTVRELVQAGKKLRDITVDKAWMASVLNRVEDAIAALRLMLDAPTDARTKEGAKTSEPEQSIECGTLAGCTSTRRAFEERVKMNITDSELEGLAVITISLVTKDDISYNLFHLKDRIQERYPPVIFTRKSSDPGIRFVWALRDEIEKRTEM